MKWKNPLIVILGATGSGKTKLSLELAQRFNSEIISADSMQLYKGLNIITAKATSEEQRLVPHHLIDILHPSEHYTVLDFRNTVFNIISDLHSRDKVPIIVGGTNYYIESLLWKILVEEPGSPRINVPGISSLNEHELPTEELHKRLQLLDPNMARRLHPNNKRKILRSLEVLQQKGKRHSDILKEQQSSEGGSSTGGGLRYPNALILWLQCNQNILDDRLDKRVDSMIENGLLKELEDFHCLYNEERIKSEQQPDYTRGVFQSIGFKEFHQYLLLKSDERVSELGKKLFNESVLNLKIATRRYARKQFRWITNRFLARADRQVPPLYGLSTDDLTKWNENVSKRAIEIVEHYINDEPCKHEPIPKKSSRSFPNSEDDTFYCENCNRVFIGSHQWTIHLNSGKHKKILSKKHKELKLQG
ncbi:trna dimethylallyltransferase [Holotrichia oblita]|uniref:Trna dimethylallyltransferase n=1 Tax=Holotrichia oblita TaxID=644536 RepID=A0ACB9TWK7_HOLOL|nr:trna dimethylallyltransferase [Holotrichia oblita]